GGSIEASGQRAVFYLDSSGAYRSVDAMNFTQVLSASGDDLRFVAMAQNQVATVYITSDAASIPSRYEAVYRSFNGGDPGTWENCFRGHPGLTDPNVEAGWITHDITWGWGGPAIGFNVNPQNPDVALFTDTGRTFLTTDAGNTWRQVYSGYAGGGAPGPGEPWSSIGLEVTSCYHYDFDPFEANRTYISYTDIGFARSQDRGDTWYHSPSGSPWTNTFYQIVFHPTLPGVLYAACSSKHDIPFWSATGPDSDTWPGGVCRSTDFGRTWTSVSNGLPDSPATSIAVDPAAPDTLYVTMYGSGVYKSTDGAASWLPTNNGLDIPGNSHVYSIKIHSDGTLFCSKTGYRFSGSDFYDNSGLFKSADGGNSWTSCNGAIQDIPAGQSWAWAIDFSVHPQDSTIIYLGAFDCTNGRVQGGIYKTVDGGATWERKRQFYRVFYPYLDPADPDHVIITAPGSGVWESRDAGENWNEIDGIPFLTTIRATFDPQDGETLYVATFGGGIWKRIAQPVPPVDIIYCTPDGFNVAIEWDDITHPDLDGYNVYRSIDAWEVGSARTPGELDPFRLGSAAPTTILSAYTDVLAGSEPSYYYTVHSY
ncbi:WD40/YVTN/BNR-like repeat-containing protein, partial [Acidobacteriota bacterium]